MRCPESTNLIPPQCAAQSVGPANQLFASLIQTFLAAQCSISPPAFWPSDYGKVALKSGKFFLNSIPFAFRFHWREINNQFRRHSRVWFHHRRCWIGRINCCKSLKRKWKLEHFTAGSWWRSTNRIRSKIYWTRFLKTKKIF